MPLARYNTPAEILTGAQERHRGLFQPANVGGDALAMLVSPFHFDGSPLALRAGPPALGAAARVEAQA